jgi:hypothetical protein
MYPTPSENTIRRHQKRGGEDIYEVYRDGKWRRLKDDEIEEAKKVAPVMIPYSHDKAPGGERIHVPPPDGR